jgi:hypothetical protein
LIKIFNRKCFLEEGGNMKNKFLVLALASAMTLGTFASSAFADLASISPMTTNRHTSIGIANTDGARFDYSAAHGAPADTYWIQADGGGLNQLHITTSTASVNGQVITRNIDKSTYSDTFWVTTTGGRGYNDDIILLASVKGPISNDFSLKIESSGYQWAPATTGSLSDVKDYKYVNAVSETYTKDDFLYGPQTAKPGPGALNAWTLPLYSGQNISDSSTAEYLMFIDLYVGNFANSKDASATDLGDAKVTFTFTGLYDTTAAFNVYAWCLASNIGGGTIDWTNKVSSSLTDVGQSGYSINTTAAAPVPVPAAIWLLGSGFSGMFFMRRRKVLS